MPLPLRSRTIKAAKVALEPGEWVRRRRARGQMTPADAGALAELRAKGNIALDRFQIPELQPALNACRKIYEEVSSDIDPSEGFNNRNLLSAERLQSYPEILNLAKNQSVVSAISAYLGQVPVIGSVQLWLSKPNPLREGSQLFHLDKVDLRQVKLFLNIVDVDADNGPFTFIPADRTAALCDRLSDPFSRVMDEEIESNDGLQHLAQITGSAGTGALVDTCRCLHCGSRISSGQRVLLLIQYLSYHCALEPNDKQWRKFAASRAHDPAADDSTQIHDLLVNARS